MGKIFISYARKDEKFVLKLAADLRAAGVDLWLDQLDISPGMTWDEAVEAALEACPNFMIVLSENAVASRPVKDELSFALEEEKHIIPVLYRTCKISFRLRRIQRSDFTGNYDPALAALLRTLGVKKKTTQPAPVKPAQETPPVVVHPPKPEKKLEPPPGMVLIPGREFLMGSNKGDGDEKPVHRVELEAFYMDKYAVSVAVYAKFLAAKNYEKPDDWEKQLQRPDCPVVCVSWDDAQAFAAWAGKRLPTEAEWECAARGGLEGKEYPWGNESPKGRANYGHDWDADWDKGAGKYLQAVNAFEQNGYGLYNMAGNVWEWCADWYDENYYKNSPLKNPQGPKEGVDRVLRGGSWSSFARVARAACRLRYRPGNRNDFRGFRCAQFS